VLATAADDRLAILVEHPEVTDQRPQPTSITRCRYDRLRLDPCAVGEQHVLAVEALDTGDDLDPA
jgi:hypothetical protein